MDHRDAGKYWEKNAEGWTRLARAGHDTARDWLNSPAFFELLPDVTGRHGLDIGCGEGYNTRLLSERCASVTALDYTATFIRHARELEWQEPRGIRHVHGNALELPFPEACFDFATAFMSLMEFPETDRALGEAFRVLRPGGFLQFSISHPCFITISRKTITDEDGRPVAVQLGEYFAPTNGEIKPWTFRTATEEVRGDIPLFEIPDFRRTMSAWVTLIIGAGFQLEAMAEPCPSEEAIARHPYFRACRVAPFFVHFRARKPA